MKKLILIALTLTTITLFSQIMNKNSTQRILIGNVVTDEGKSIDCEIEITNPAGKRFVVKTVNGSFEQVLDAETKYTFTFVGDDILREEQEVTVAKPDKDFTKAEKTFKVLKLAKGKTLRKFDLFEDGTANLKANTKKAIKEMKMLLRFNRSIKVNFICTGAGDLAAQREAALSEMTAKDKRFMRSVVISSGEGTNDAEDVIVKIDKVVDRMK